LQTEPATGDALVSYPISFDLRGDERLERKAFWSTQGPFVIVGIGFGCMLAVLGIVFYLGYAGGTPTLGLVTAVSGAGFAIATTIGVRYTMGSEVVGLRIHESRIEFSRQNRRGLVIEWADPSLKLNLCQFLADPGFQLPQGDARRIHPQWIDVFQPPSRRWKVETTVPPEALRALQREAARHGLLITPVRVAYWWHSVPKGPGYLDFDPEGQLGTKRQLNGLVTRIRGSAWKGVVED
jgi:hypothetical protein